MEAERLKKVLDEGIPVAVDTKVVKVAPAARVTKAITVTRAAKMGFDRTVRQARVHTYASLCCSECCMWQVSRLSFSRPSDVLGALPLPRPLPPQRDFVLCEHLHVAV